MERIRSHLSYANVVATAALLLAMSGGAIAATGGFDSGGTLKACVNHEGTIKLLKSGKHCRRGQKTIAWNQTGPAGPAGPTGATGATGAPGANGQPTNLMWARIDEEGIIEDGSHGVTRVTDSGKSPYKVTFEKDITNCSLLATHNGSYVESVVTAQPDGTSAYVHITLNGAEIAAPFSIVAIC
jgi:hypothetical protein